MGGRRAICLVVGVPLGLVLVAQGCATFPDSECTVLAMCGAADQDGDSPLGDGAATGDRSSPIDAPIDSLVIPDGPLPDGTCNNGAEDCTNGKDDNCNGLVDCADPVCMGAGYACINVPSGWQGPVSLWEAASGSAPACAGAFVGASADAMAGLSAPPATCAACNCSKATGQSCTGVVTMYTGGCGSACSGTYSVTDMGCTNLGACGSTNDQSAKYPTPTTSGGSCSASGGAPTIPAISWGTESRTCAYSAQKGAGCIGGASCYAGTAAPFTAVCVSQAGDVMCPSGFSKKHLYYSGVSDARSCTACGCGGASGGTCNESVQFWSSTGCSSFPITTTIPANTCADTYITNGSLSGSVKGHFSIATAGSCTPNGGQPQGSAAPNTPTTVCCP